MALNTEIAEIMEKPGTMFEVAEKVEYKQSLTSEEKDIYNVADCWAKEIGKKGYDDNREIAAFVNKTVTEEIYNAPDELLDTMFNRGSIGEFDDVEYTKTPKNTLEAIESAKGGTVDRSWIDTTAIKPITKNRQVETDVSYADLRKNGFKSVATLSTYAKEALQNAFFYDVFSMIDSAIVGGDQLITAGGSAPTQDAVDKMTLYLIDRNPDAVAVCLSKYAQKLYRMSGYENYLSEKQKDDFNRYGLVKFLDGVRIASISGARKTGKGQLLLPDKRIYGVAGIVGDLDMKGELHTYEDFDNSNEKVIIRVKDFTYSVGITNIENCCKMVLTD